ncbi:hypothetical protein ACNSZH_26710 [Burkholderia gladioli]|uniref:hypothetical protein n=3 Tax=Burkholderia gladioli TaxID=28095 RepID=UPI003B9811A6
MTVQGTPTSVRKSRAARRIVVDAADAAPGRGHRANARHRFAEALRAAAQAAAETEAVVDPVHARPRRMSMSTPAHAAPNAIQQRVAIAIVKPRQCGGSVEPVDPLRPLSRGLAARAAVS